MYEAGFLSVIAALILLIKLPRHWVRRMLWLDVPVDILVTFGFTFLFYGTYSGMMAAIIAGLLFSIVFGIAKHILGYEKPVLRDGKLEWISVPGAWL